MIAKLWYRKLVLGQRTFSEVPTLLKDAVMQLLIDNEMTEYLGEGE